MSDWHKNCFYRVSLKALIRNKKGEILMVAENEATNLSLPGGGLDYGESAHECLKRELHEEIALTSEFSEKLVHMQTLWRETRGGWWLMWLVYEIEYESLEFSLGKDGVTTKWVSPEDLPDDVASMMIRKALNND